MKDMPFHSQIVNCNNEDSGFPDEEQVRKWERNGCGIACLRMILDYYGWNGGAKKLSYWELLSFAFDANAYCDKGWIHQGLLNVARHFGVDGRCHRNAEIEAVVDAIGRGSSCIVSVTKWFLGGQKDASGIVLPRGGHLVVAFAVAGTGQGATQIVCNHPSSSPAWNKSSWAVDLDRWRSSFSGNFIEFRGRSEQA